MCGATQLPSANRTAHSQSTPSFRQDISFGLKLADAVIAPVLCGGVTAYKALKISGETPEQWIEISGVGGGVGSLAIQYVCAMGYRAIAIDAGQGYKDD